MTCHGQVELPLQGAVPPGSADLPQLLSSLDCSRVQDHVPRSDFRDVRRIAIVGAGVAGLQAAALLSREGFECRVFEEAGDVGGVWRRNYADFALQDVPDLAFIGSEVSTFNNILTHGLQCLWLQKLLTGSIQLLPRDKMALYVEKEKAWKRSWMPESDARAALWQLHMMKYHDLLCRDMGASPLRKGANLCGECFAPYNARDYAALFQPRCC